MLRESFPQSHLGSSLHWGQKQQENPSYSHPIWETDITDKARVEPDAIPALQVDKPQLLSKLQRKQNQNHKDNISIVATLPPTRNFIT